MQKGEMKTATIVRLAIAVIAVAYITEARAQGKTPSSPLDSFCGFKVGTNEQKIIKTAKADKKFGNAFPGAIKAKASFRKFHNVFLDFSENGELSSVYALAYIDKMKHAAMKKELDECCKALSVFDGMKGLATTEWRTDGDDRYEKDYEANGVAINIQGDANVPSPFGQASTGAKLQIAVSWDLVVLRRKPIAVKRGNHIHGNGISLREFVEKTFGVAFGKGLQESVSLDAKDPSSSFPVSRKLSSPVCGLKDVVFWRNSSDSLECIELAPSSNAVKVKDKGEIKAKVKKFCGDAGKWLGIASFSEKECGENRLEMVFEEDGLSVEAYCEYFEKNGALYAYGCGLTFTAASRTGEAQNEAEKPCIKHWCIQISQQDLAEKGNQAKSLHNFLRIKGILWPEGSGYMLDKASGRLYVWNTEENLEKVLKLLR